MYCGKRGFFLLSMIVLVAVLLVVTGCSKKTPQEVIDVNQALAQAKDDCASVYAADDLGQVQDRVDSMNSLVDEKKMGKAKKEAKPLGPEIDTIGAEAMAAKDAAKIEANEVPFLSTRTEPFEPPPLVQQVPE